jgi:hypothetical protein
MTGSVTPYQDLITSEHSDKPKYMEMVGYSAQPYADTADTFSGVTSAYDVDTAVGNQLDVVGQWIGITRFLSTPLEVYFSFDNATLGFDRGTWKGPYDPTAGIIELTDDYYRLLLKTKIMANVWNGTLEQLNQILSTIMPDINGLVLGISTTPGILGTDQPGPGITMLVVDNQDMTMSVYVVGVGFTAILIAIMKLMVRILKPEGVGIKSFEIASVGGSPLFAFDSNSQYAAGFDTGSFGVPF